MLSMGWYRLLATELERKNNRGGWGGGGIGWGGGGSAGRGGDDLNAQETAKWRREEIEPHRVRERRRLKKKKTSYSYWKFWNLSADRFIAWYSIASVYLLSGEPSPISLLGC